MTAPVYIWVVDDNPDDRDLAVHALRPGFPKAEFFTPIDEPTFRSGLAGDLPHVVITDYRVRWIDGLEVLRLVHDRNPMLPVIMFTNTGSEEVCATGMKRGLFDYIIKRADQFAKLPHAVRLALEFTRAQQTVARQNVDLERSQAELAALLERERRARSDAEIAKTEALRATKLKDEFLATLSHELRSPLNAMLGWAELLRAKHGSNKDLADGLAVISRNARLQAQLIEDLLDMSRIVSGKMRLDVQEVDVSSTIKLALDTVRPAAAQKGVQITSTLDPAAGAIHGDPARMQQIVWNLVNNAVKFTPAGGNVNVRLERAQDNVRLVVSDTGCGIAPEFLPLIFEPFRQADQGTTRTPGGLGLGLSIVKNLTELHGGRVEARSGGLGQGAQFNVLLPIAPAKQTAAVPAVDSSLQPFSSESLAGIRILLVDDDPDTCDLVRNILRQYGAQIVCASSARSALDKLVALRPDVVISDIGMPEEDGYSFVAKIRELPDPHLAKIPAAALSAFARSEDRQRALLSGFDSYTTKPVEPNELVAVVANLAARGRRRQG